MLKIALTVVAASLLAAGCTPHRSAATGASSTQAQSDERPRTDSAGRAAGAGGSHAPGSTGSGHGTFGAGSTADMGSVR